MPKEFSPHLLNCVQRLFLADDLVEFCSILQDNSATLLTDEAVIAFTSLLDFASEQKDDYRVARVRTILHILQQCRQRGLDHTLAELEETIDVQTAVLRLLMTTSLDDMRQSLRDHADIVIKPAAVDFLRQLIEVEVDEQNLFNLRYRLALLERVQKVGLDTAIKWEERAELFRAAMNTRSPDEAREVIAANLADFISGQMGELFTELLSEHREDKELVKKLYKIRGIIIEVHQAKPADGSLLTPAWLRTGESERDFLNLLIKNPTLNDIQETFNANPQLMGVIPTIIDKLGLNTSMASEPTRPPRPESNSYRSFLESSFSEVKDDAKIESLHGKMIETYGPPGGPNSVYYDCRLALLEPWLVDLNLPELHLELARTLAIDGDALRREFERYSLQLARLDARSEPLEWSRLHRILASLLLMYPAGDRTEILSTAYQHCDAAVRVLKKRTHPQAWANAHALYGEVLLAQLGRGSRGIIEHKLRAIEPTMFGRIEYEMREFGYIRETADKAMGEFDLVLQVYRQGYNPESWAAALVGLGTALAVRWRGNQERNARESRACFKAALSVLSKATSPHLWAAAQARCGYAAQYSSEVGTQNMTEEVSRHFDLATQVWTSSHYPERYCAVAEQTATFLFSRGDWEGALKAIDGTIDTSLRLSKVSVLTPEFMEEMKRVSYLWGIGAYCLVRLKLFDQALSYVERGGRVFDTVGGFKTSADILGCIPPSTVVVAPIVTEQGTVVFVLRSGQNAVRDTDVFRLDELNDDYLSSLLVGGDPKANNREKGWLYLLGEWYEYRANRFSLTELSAALTNIMGRVGKMLIAPLVESLGDTQDTIVWVPHRGLGILPIHAAWEQEQEGERRYLGDLYAISYTSSISKLRDLAKREEPHMPSVLTVRPIAQPPLRFAETECAAIASNFTKVEHLSGEKATRAAVLRAITKYSHVHFACHGETNWDDIRQSALELSDGPLTLYTVETHRRLAAVRLMTLSACETGMTDFRHLPSANYGLQNSLRDLGVRCVISSLWSVADIAALLLMERFYEMHVGERLPPHVALAKAQRWLRHLPASEVSRLMDEGRQDLPESSDPEHPFVDIIYWAPFIATGQ